MPALLRSGVPGLYSGEGEPLVPSDEALRALVEGDHMRLTGFALEMSVFLYCNTRKRERVVKGTAFILSEPVPGVPLVYWHYLVTARHVIEQIRHASVDGTVFVRVNLGPEPGTTWHEMPLSAWRTHPADRADIQGDEWLHSRTGEQVHDVAVALCPASVIDAGTVMPWPTDLVLDDAGVRDREIGPGDELAVIGLYYRREGKVRMTPVARAGTIAAMPSDHDLIPTDAGQMRAYLIESRSTGGLSGSPVIWVSEPKPIVDPLHRGAGLELSSLVQFRLLGLMVGSFDTPGYRPDEPINEGIAFVAPGADILDTLRQDVIMTERKNAERELRQTSPRVARLDAAHADDEGRVSLSDVEPEDALRALLKTPPHGQTQDPA